MKKVVSKDGTRIAFNQSGQGPPLILVAHVAVTRMDQALLAAALAPYFTVFAYDRRGRGESGDTPPYAVEREIDDLDALIDKAGGSADVFGTSDGAVLALDAARLLSAKITKLAVYEPPLIVDESHPPAPTDFARRLNELVAAGRRGDAVEYFHRQIGVPTEMIAQMRSSPLWPQLEAMAPTFAYTATIVEDTQTGDPAPLRKWETVTVPTLVLDGDVFMGRTENHAFFRHGADALASVLPNAKRRTLEGQDHEPSHDVLAAALQEFFLD